MSANFLLYPEAFNLSDNSSFCNKVSVLFDTIKTAREENDDDFYRAPNLTNLEISGKYLYEFTYFDSTNYEADKDEKLKILPCLTDEIRKNLIILLQNPITEMGSEDLKDLNEIEFPEQCNGLAGLDFKNVEANKNECIWDIDSWYGFHFHCYFKNPENDSFIQNQKKHQGREFNEYFPNLKYSNELSNDSNWSLFYKHNRSDKEKELYRKIFGADERIALIMKLAPFVAQRNFYKYNQDLSNHNDKTNTNRGKKTTPYQIFEKGVGRNKVYLSTDFETGAFEICDYKGSHIGEYFFNGNYNKNSKDESGGHDIVIPC